MSQFTLLLKKLEPLLSITDFILIAAIVGLLFVKPLQRELLKIRTVLESLIKDLSKKRIISYSKFFKNLSPKQITDDGRKLLDKSNINNFLSGCDLLNNDFSQKKESDIYIECFKWIEQNGKEKALEMVYNNDISEEDAKILLSLAVLNKILSKNRND